MKSKQKIYEDLKHKEEELIKQLGYVPTSFIEEWEWEAQLKRLEISNEQEKKHEPKTE